MGKSEQKSESKTELPAWYVPYAKQGLAFGQKLAQQGYTPYQGPDVAAFAPQQVQAMQMANDTAAAFGGAGAKLADVSKQLMPAQDFGNGLKGFSSYGGYQDALAKLKKNQPGLYDYITSMSIDPQTGAAPKMFSNANSPSAPPPTNSLPPGTTIDPVTGLPIKKPQVYLPTIGGSGGRN